jgi:beta-mannanase
MKNENSILSAWMMILVAVIFLAGIVWYEFFYLPRPSHKIWGAYTGNTAESLASFQKDVGKKVDISAIFLNWTDPFPSDLVNPVKQNSQTLLIFWEPGDLTLDQIISGQQDDYIKQFAGQISAYNNPVILAPFEEMNGNWDVWDGAYGSNTPAKVVQAWQHTHDLFLGVKNVKWGFDVNNVSTPDTKENAIANYYPGDSYVDYVGVDGFNFGDPWQSYSELFSSALKQLKTYKKPIYIFSMACAEGAQKPAWITDALTQIQSDSSISGWVWFNENKEKNWLVDSSKDSLKAFQSNLK